MLPLATGFSHFGNQHELSLVIGFVPRITPAEFSHLITAYFT